MEKANLKEQTSCLNCGQDLPPKAKYCPYCSQKNTTGRISVGSVLGDAFDTIFNIDSQFFRTIGAIFIPGRLTLEYFKGRHKKYVPPFRLFFLLGIIHFAAIGFVAFNNFRDEIAQFQNEERSTAFHSGILKEIDSFKEKLVDTTFNNDPIAKSAFDTLYSQIDAKGKNLKMALGYFYFDNEWAFKVKEVPITMEEIFSLAEDEILEKSNVAKNFLAEAQIRQELRVIKDPGEFFRFAIGQLIWMVVLMMFALGLLLKFFYIRRDRYYVEHLVFSFHYHAFSFLIVTIPLLLMAFNPEQFSNEKGFVLIGAAFLVVLIYLYIAMKRVYQQGWFKTFIKFCLLNFSYLIIFNLFLFFSLTVSVFFF